MGVLTERLDGGAVICAEGYLLSWKGAVIYKAGAFVPEVVLEHPRCGVAITPRVFTRRQ